MSTLCNRTFCRGIPRACLRIQNFAGLIFLCFTLCNWTFCSGVTTTAVTLSNWTFCSGVCETCFQQLYTIANLALRFLSLSYRTFHSGVTTAVTLCNWTFCSGVNRDCSTIYRLAGISTLCNWTFCSGVNTTAITLYNRTFCSGVKGTCLQQLHRLAGLISYFHFTLCNWTLCSGVNTTAITLSNWTFCSGVNGACLQFFRFAGLLLQLFTLCNWTLCGGNNTASITLSNWTFCSGFNGTCFQFFSFAGLTLQFFTLCNRTFCSGVNTAAITLSNRTFCSGVNRTCLQFFSFAGLTLQFFTLCNWTFCSGVNTAAITLSNWTFCSGVNRTCLQFFNFAGLTLQFLTLCNWTFCSGVNQGHPVLCWPFLTLCNWAFCSGVIFIISTPFNWTFCGGVITIFTLYNWAFCSGVIYNNITLNNRTFCSGVISILTLCNWIFCSRDTFTGFQTLRCATILNLVLYLTRFSIGHLSQPASCSHHWIRKKLSLNFTDCFCDLSSSVITSACWGNKFLIFNLIWRLQNLGLHIIWIFIQVLWHLAIGPLISTFDLPSFFQSVHTYTVLTWKLRSREILRASPIDHWCRSGPKSRRPFGKIFLGLCCLWFFMLSSHLDRGEGCDPVMRVTETSAALPWMSHLPTIADVKHHDMRPPVSSAIQSRSPTQVTKRSLKRAQKRAHQHGVAWYKGRLYRPEDFHFMPPLDPAQVPIAEPTPAANAQLASCNRIHGNKRRITCMQWNVGGLSRHRLDEVKSWLSTQHVQVITLIETRWSYTGEWLDPDWIHIHSGLPGSKGTGILTLISRKLCSDRDIRWQEVDVGRLVHIRIPTPGRPLDLICGYQHVDNRNATCLQKRDTWWNKLDQVLQSIPQRNLLLLMADFNCNVPECTSYSGSEWYRWGQTLTKGSQHQDAGRLLSLLRYHGLVVLNSWNARDGPTFVQGQHSSRIDYACVRKSHVDGISKQPKYLWQAPFMGPTMHGHVPILHQIAIYWAHTKSMKPKGITKQQEQQAKMAMKADSSQWSAYLQASADVMQSSLDQVLTSAATASNDLTVWHQDVNHCFHAFFPPMSAITTKQPWKQTNDLILNKFDLVLDQVCFVRGTTRPAMHA